MDARRGSGHHTPAADSRLGGRVAGPRSAAARGRHAAVRTGRLPPSDTPGRKLRIPGRRRGTDRRPGLRHSVHTAQPHRTAAQRQQRLRIAHRRPAARHPLDPHGVLHHPRRPHRPHHRRDTDSQGPCRAGGTGHLRRRGLVAAEPRDAAAHARSRDSHRGFRAGPLPVEKPPIWVA